MQAQQRCFAGTGRPRQKTEIAWPQHKAHVTQDFRSLAITQADIFETHHLVNSPGYPFAHL